MTLQVCAAALVDRRLKSDTRAQYWTVLVAVLCFSSSGCGPSLIDGYWPLSNPQRRAEGQATSKYAVGAVGTILNDDPVNFRSACTPEQWLGHLPNFRPVPGRAETRRGFEARVSAAVVDALGLEVSHKYQVRIADAQYVAAARAHLCPDGDRFHRCLGLLRADIDRGFAVSVITGLYIADLEATSDLRGQIGERCDGGSCPLEADLAAELTESERGTDLILGIEYENIDGTMLTPRCGDPCMLRLADDASHTLDQHGGNRLNLRCAMLDAGHGVRVRFRASAEMGDLSDCPGGHWGDGEVVLTANGHTATRPLPTTAVDHEMNLNIDVPADDVLGSMVAVSVYAQVRSSHCPTSGGPGAAPRAVVLRSAVIDVSPQEISATAVEAGRTSSQPVPPPPP